MAKPSAIKKNLGQFYTTNYEYILQGLNIPQKIKTIIEPFTGAGDLLNFIPNDYSSTIEKYDIDPKCDGVIQRDTLKNPPIYKDKFILTNPPYLARNKAIDKTIFELYNQNDLYKCFLQSIINDVCIGGIIIIPLNFWCSIRKSDVELRKRFLEYYSIECVNIHKEASFIDTGYTICAIQFTSTRSATPAKWIVYPENKQLFFDLYNYTIGGEIYDLPQTKTIIIERLTSKNITRATIEKTKTNILVKCIDDSDKINLSLVDETQIYIDTTPKLSARSYTGLMISPALTLEQQKQLVDKFNKIFNEWRQRYNSLFLTNYREGNRKRISFTLVFEIINYIIGTLGVY